MPPGCMALPVPCASSDSGRRAAELHSSGEQPNDLAVTENPNRQRTTRERLGHAGDLARSTRYDGTTWLVVGSIVAGLSAYGFQVLGGRALGTEAFAPIATLWTVQYIVSATSLLAIEQFEVRAVAAAGGVTSVLKEVSRVLWTVIAAMSVGVTLMLLGLSDRVLLGSWDLAFVGGLWVMSTGALAVARGIAGGRAAYRVAGIATGSDSLARLMLAVPVLAAFGTTRSLAWVMPLGPLAFLVWWWVRGREETGGVAAPGRVSPRPGRFLAATSLANGTLQLLLGAGPLVVALLGASPREVSAFFVTTSLARAPLLVGIGLVPRLLTPLTRRAGAGDYGGAHGLAWMAVASTATLAAFAGLLAYALGPTIVGTLYSGEFVVSRLTTGATVAAVMVALGGLGLNQVLIAENRAQGLVPAWLAGLAVAIVAVVILPIEPLPRVAIAVLAGQIVAICSLAAAVMSTEHRVA